MISAGNDAQDNDAVHHYPCDYRPTVDAVPPGPVDNVVCVAATNQADGLASFSDWGAVSVDLGAPGTEVLSSHPASNRYGETFAVDDFASKWSTIAPNNFARSTEAPLTSAGITDSPGAAPTPSALYQTTLTTGFALPADIGACTFSGRRYLSLGGGSFSYTVFRNGANLFTSNPGNTAGSSMVKFNTVPIGGLAGGSIQLRFTFAAPSSPTAANGAWLDDLKLDCLDSATSTDATYQFLQGTSMAAPHVAGVAGLLFSQRPAATVTEVRDALLDSADPVAALAGRVATGGRLNASQALDLFDDHAPASPTLSSTPATGNDNSPEIRGTAEERSTVRLYDGAGCAGAPFATVPAEALAAPGVTIAVSDNATRSFSATATDTADNVSACSSTLSYVERTPIVALPPSPPAVECMVPKLKGKTLRQAKRALKKANCALGKVTKPRRSRGRKLIVKSTTPRAGSERAAGTKVAVKLKAKPKPRKRKRR